jgi:HEAT repeat protein
MKTLILTSILILILLLLQAELFVPRVNVAASSPTAYSPDVAADVAKQIKKLQSKDPYARVRAAYALGDMGYRAAPAVPFLINALGDTQVGKSLADKLFGFLFLGGGGCGVSTAAMNNLVRIGSPAVDPLIGALRNHNSRIRYHAASALGSLALGGIKAHNAVPSLIEALHDENSQVKNFAARSLGDIGDQRAVEPLIRALRDEDMGVRGDAASALGKLKNKRAIRPLLAMLKERKQNYQFAAEALREITGQSFGDDLRKWQEFCEKTYLNND